MSSSEKVPVSSGSCLCGAVHYTLSSPPQQSVFCHCINCKKASGSAFAANDWYNQRDLQITAEPPSTIKVYRDMSIDAEGGEVRRHFCDQCGSPIYIANPKYPEYVIVPRGTNDGKFGREHAMDAKDKWEGDSIPGKSDTWLPDTEFYCKRRMASLPDMGSKTFQSMN